MKFFCKNQDREGTGYLEFLPHHWDGETFWADESVYILPECMDRFGLESAIRKVVPGFDIYGLNYELTRDQWDQVLDQAKEVSKDAVQAATEIKEWLVGEVLSILCV